MLAVTMASSTDCEGIMDLSVVQTQKCLGAGRLGPLALVGGLLDDPCGVTVAGSPGVEDSTVNAGVRMGPNSDGPRR